LNNLSRFSVTEFASDNDSVLHAVVERQSIMNMQKLRTDKIFLTIISLFPLKHVFITPHSKGQTSRPCGIRYVSLFLHKVEPSSPQASPIDLTVLKQSSAPNWLSPLELRIKKAGKSSDGAQFILRCSF
jgi:hypothetical protein